MTSPAVRIFTRALAGSAIALSAGCDRGGSTPEPDAPATAQRESSTVSIPAAAATVSVVVPPTVAHGATVPIAVRVKNPTSAPLDLYLRGREVTFDIVVTDSDGRVIWRRLQGEPIPAILQVRTLQPGEVLELDHQWDQRTTRGNQTAAGTYDVRATVLTDGSSTLESDEGSFEIRPAARP